MLKAKRTGAAPTVWMSRAEVARVLQVAPVTIGRWASQGKLPHSFTLGGRRRFRRDDIVAIARQLALIVNPSSYRAAGAAVESSSGVFAAAGATSVSPVSARESRLAVASLSVAASPAPRSPRPPRPRRRRTVPVKAERGDGRSDRSRRAEVSTFSRTPGRARGSRSTGR
jgi:excisionase family DNA binding protein